MSHLDLVREDLAETAVRDYVLKHAALAVYDPAQFRRPKAEVVSFDIELLEVDDESSIVHAAGPVLLRASQGDVEQFLRISVPVQFDGERCVILEGAAIRAAYITPTEHPNGACKETAALANV